MTVLWYRFIRQWWHIPSHWFGRNKPYFPKEIDTWYCGQHDPYVVIECECGWHRRVFT